MFAKLFASNDVLHLNACKTLQSCSFVHSLDEISEAENIKNFGSTIVQRTAGYNYRMFLTFIFSFVFSWCKTKSFCHCSLAINCTAIIPQYNIKGSSCYRIILTRLSSMDA